MRKTSDKVLDIMYRLMDILIVVAIIIIIVLVLTSKLSPMLGEKDKTSISKDTETEEVEITRELPPTALDKAKAEDNKDNKDATPTPQVSPSDPATPTEVLSTPQEAKKLTIPEANSSYEIGEVVAKAGYAKSAKEFSKRANELGLDTRLIPGTYEIPAGATLDDVIKIIARSK